MYFAVLLLLVFIMNSIGVAAMAIRGSRRLGGSSDLVVSEACLGTMTWGVQNTQEDALAQLNVARDAGVNFVDTAELYPVPLTAPEWKAGVTEEILGKALSTMGGRDDFMIATKVAGYMPQSPVAAQRSVPPDSRSPLPDGRLDAPSVKAACEASLRRLQTDRIDLMQLHWPDRYVPLFGQTLFDHEKIRKDAVPIRETAEALKQLIDEGKVRYIGLSNESPFGVGEWVRATEDIGIRDKLVSIQNSYSLLDRRFDSDLAECCDHYNIGLLPWSVLAGGLLSGKYSKAAHQQSTEQSRFTKYPDYMKRWNPSSASASTLDAVDEYIRIADEAKMAPSELAISFVRSRSFVADRGSIIVGATTVDQLKENLVPFEDTNFQLDEEVEAAVNAVHSKCRDPSCSL